MTLITISASYGAGGSRVAPELARRLGVPFLGRPPEPRLHDARDGETAEEQAGEEGIGTGGRRLLSWVASLAVSWGTPAGLTVEELLPDEARRHELEAEVEEFARAGAGVILGRGAAVVLHDHPRALHVLLDGPVEARVRQAMEIEGIDRATAERRLQRVDRFRRAYLEDLYGLGVREPGAFHLVMDSTALSLATCAETIAVAAAAPPRTRRGGTLEGQ
jgi:cytidylate kinase